MHPRRPPHSILWAMRNVTGAEVYRQESVSRRPLRRRHNLIGHRLLDGDLDGSFYTIETGVRPSWLYSANAWPAPSAKG
jgi:hypothetical protein